VPLEGKQQETVMVYLACTLLIGIGATALTDLWAIARRRLLGVPLPNYGLVGRWLAHMPRGRFRHESIAAVEPVRGERLVGWTAHYLIGIAFATMLLGIWGLEWVRHPTLVPALIVGIGTVAAPFLVMQPGMGAGIAASRTPRPAAARFQSLATHAIFGLGLYAAGWATRLMYAP
jgi:predicted permease